MLVIFREDDGHPQCMGISLWQKRQDFRPKNDFSMIPYIRSLTQLSFFITEHEDIRSSHLKARRNTY
jgi:hypothetical protein